MARRKSLDFIEKVGLAGEKDESTASIALLRVCSKNKDLCSGTILHDDILRRGLLAKCSDALVTMYAKCDALAKAKTLFSMHKSRDVFTWTALIAGYARTGRSHDALHHFKRMQHEGLSPTAVTFVCILKACGNLRAVDEGGKFHDDIVQLGLQGNNIILGNALVDMYAKCGALEKARQVLESLPVRDTISWNALIAGYTHHEEAERALNCFERMRSEGLFPDAVTCYCILKACASIGATDVGQKVHEEIANRGLLRNNIVLGNALVDMYSKCGALTKARQVLEWLPERNLISWTAVISGYAERGESGEALHCFEHMQQQGLSPDSVTFICILKACGSIGAADKGEKIHDEIAKRGMLGNDVVLGTALVDMYAKCGALTKARRVHEELPVRNVVSWNALISGYVHVGEFAQALDCFDGMEHEGLSPDVVTFICCLKACCSIGATDKGEKIHNDINKQKLLENNIVLGNALVDMYVKSGALTKARHVLEELPERNAASWNALISGCVQQGEGAQALTCFELMQHEGISPDALTYTCILKACGTMGAADKGEKIHDEIAKQGLLGNDTILGSALVDMYAKCGALLKAQQVLKELPVRDVVSWNALISGYVQQGEGEQALNCFEQIHYEGLNPHAVTFSHVLSVCSRLGLVEDAQMYYGIISTKYGMIPDFEHYACMVNLFGRSGDLDKAVRVLEKAPSFYSGLHCALLGACEKWGDVNVGRWAFGRTVVVEKTHGAVYAGVVKDVENIEVMRVENKAWKNPAQNWWIDMYGGVH